MHPIRQTVLGCTAAIGLMVASSLTSAHAYPIVWDFSNPIGKLGTSQTYDSTPVVAPSQKITASGFTIGGATVNLFGKNDGTGEQGLGLANDPSKQNEITSGSFIQFDLTQLSSPPLNSARFSFQANSTTPNETGGETWLVYGTNTAGSLDGAKLIDSGKDNNLVSDLGASILGTYKYLDVTAGKGGNVLVRELDNSVPEPASLALLGAGLCGVGWIRRKRA